MPNFARLQTRSDVEGGETDAEGYKGIFTAMAKEFGFKYVISTCVNHSLLLTTAGRL